MVQVAAFRTAPRASNGTPVRLHQQAEEPGGDVDGPQPLCVVLRQFLVLYQALRSDIKGTDLTPVVRRRGWGCSQCVRWRRGRRAEIRGMAKLPHERSAMPQAMLWRLPPNQSQAVSRA